MSVALGAGVVSIASPIGSGAASAALSAPVLVRDVNTNQNQAGSAIADMIEVGGVLFFTADDGVHGRELWRSDGTPAGTRMVVDLNPEGPSTPSDLADVNGTLYFTADNGADGREPFALDPTTTVPVSVADIGLGAVGSDATGFVAANGAAWFVATNNVGTQLYRTDSIASPTTATLVEPDPIGTAISVTTPATAPPLVTVTYPAPVGQVVWMVADTVGIAATEVVGVDATNTMYTLSDDLDPEDLTVVDGTTLYYNDGALVRVDQAPGGFVGDPVGANVIDIATAGATVYATVDDGIDVELYVLAGTALDPIAPGLSLPHSFASVGGSLYFVADEAGVAGEELWRTDGVTTELVLDVNPDPLQLGVFAGPWVAGGNVYFVGDDGVSPELYVATAASAFQIPGLDIFTGAEIGGFTEFAGAVHFFGDPGAIGVELLTTPLAPIPGPGLVTTLVDIVTGTERSFPYAVGGAADRVFWGATDDVDPLSPTTEYEPYVYDPVSGLSGLLKDVNVGAGSSNPIGFTRIGDVTVFSAEGATGDAELWVTDGTADGTQRLLDINPGSVGSNPAGFTRVGNVVYFTADDGDTGRELWKTDGTAGGTGIVKDINPLSAASDPDHLVEMGGTLYFVANGPGGSQLWRSNGTAAGTTAVGTTATVSELAASDTYLIFTSEDGTGQEPWWSDGVTTRLLQDGAPEPLAFAPSRYTRIGNDIWFFASGPAGDGLWRTDGSVDGTEQVFTDPNFTADLGPSASIPAIAQAGASGVVFAATTTAVGATDYVLWQSDGTPAGTGPVDGGYNLPVAFATLNGWTYFTATTPATGRELWRTDGTNVDWVSNYGVADGPADGAEGADGLWPVGDRLYFQGITPAVGMELYYVADVPPVPAAPTGLAATPGVASVTLSWNEVTDVPFAPTTHYRVDATPVSPSGTPRSCDTAGLTCTVTGLPQGEPFTFTVSAINRSGSSAPSASVIASALSAPGTPGAPTATAGLLSANVTWSAVANPAGAPVTGYTVVASPGGATCTTTGATTCTVTNLTAGTEYTFQVRASNIVGNGPLSAASNAVTPTSPAIPPPPPGVPAAPAAPSAVAKVRAALVSWTAVTGPVGAPVTGYTVTAAPGGATCTSTGTSCTVTGLTAGTSYTFTVVATNSAGNSPSSPASSAVVPVPPLSVPLTPGRILDTRIGPDYTTVDRLHEGVGRREAGSTYELQVAGRGGVPADASAVMLNVTAVQPEGDGFLTIFPCGADRPTTSSVNYRLGEVVPNAVLAKLDADGKICIFTLAAGHVLVDVNGYVPAGGSPSTVVPARILETRSGDGLITSDGQAQGIGRRTAGTTLELQVTGRGGVPNSADAVMLNVTAVLPSGDGFLTVFPCGADRPLASSVNYRAGEVVPNAVLAKIGTGGKVCIFTLADVDLLADVSGYVPAGASPSTVLPARLLETRSGAGADTVDGLFEGGGRQSAGTTLELQVTGRGGVPSDATAVMLNVTAVLPSGDGFLTVFPCGTDRPLASSVNYAAGEVVPNAVLAKVGTGGKVCIFTLAETDLVVDVNAAVVPV